MKIRNHIRLAVFLMGLGLTPLWAGDAATYKVGEVAGKDIVTPITFEVIDPAATLALQTSEGAKTPAIFRDYAGVTNGIAEHFNAAFALAQSNFISSIQETYHQTTLDEATATAADFGYLVTAFNIKNRDFPITSAVALEWAYGKSGSFERDRLLGALLQAMQFHIRPDMLPAGYGAADSWQIIPVAQIEEKLTLNDSATRGQIIPKTDLLPWTQACLRFRRAFTGFDEQPLARTLAGWLKPNCFPDTALTQQVRDQAVGQLVVAEHYTAGQVIAPQGSVINAKIKAALDELQIKLGSASSPANAPTVPTAVSLPPADVATVVSVAPAPAPISEVTSPATETPVAVPEQINQAPPVQPVKIKAVRRPGAVVFILAAVSVFALLIFVGAGIWQLISRRRAARNLATVKDLSMISSAALSTALAPQLVEAVREALVQELAGQRRELLYVQQSAAMEVARLVHKMDHLQMALNQRLQVYEQQIQRLETELAARTEENHELIKMKIEMIRQQRQTESVAERVEFN